MNIFPAVIPNLLTYVNNIEAAWMPVLFQHQFEHNQVVGGSGEQGADALFRNLMIFPLQGFPLTQRIKSDAEESKSHTE